MDRKIKLKNIIIPFLILVIGAFAAVVMAGDDGYSQGLEVGIKQCGEKL